MFNLLNPAAIASMALPWLFKQLGVAKWLETRAMHAPEAAMPDLANATQIIAASFAKAGGVDRATPYMWYRAVELVQAHAVEGTLVTLMQSYVTK